MSSQYAKLRRIAAVLIGSLAAMLPNASSDSTTPQPNVSSALLRSSTVTSCDGSRNFIEMAKYNPAGPPPRHRALMRVGQPLGVRFPSQCARALTIFQAQSFLVAADERSDATKAPNARGRP